MFAEIRDLQKALKYIRRAIAVSPLDTDNIHLLAILLSGKNLYCEAVQTCNTGLLIDEHNFSLMITKAKILTNSGKTDQALAVYKSALELWRSLFEQRIKKREPISAKNSFSYVCFYRNV